MTVSSDREPRAGFYSSRGLQLEYLEWPATRSPRLVFVHGYMDNAWSWFPLIERVAEQHHCVSVSLAGHGGSDWADSYAWIDFVHDARRAVEVLGEGPVVLVGHSMGGHVATTLAYYCPSLVSGLIVIDGFDAPIKAPLDYSVVTMAREHAAKLSQPRTWPVKYDSFEAIIDRRRRLSPRIPDESLSAGTRHGTVRTDEGWTWSADPRLAGRFYPWDTRYDRPVDVYRLWSGISCPVLLLSGGQAEAEHLTPNRDAAWKAEKLLPNIVHRHFPQCGHYIHHEDPDGATAAILDFLDSEMSPR